jgi:5-methylcytosine-specific restriction endonuclease McrA
MPVSDPITGRPWRTASAKVRALGLPCWLCGIPIDYQAPARTRWSYSTDHVIPRNHGGSLLDPTNLRPAHYGCNSARHDDPPQHTQAPKASQTW